MHLLRIQLSLRIAQYIDVKRTAQYQFMLTTLLNKNHTHNFILFSSFHLYCVNTTSLNPLDEICANSLKAFKTVN